MNQSLSPMPCGKQDGKPVHFLGLPVHPVDIWYPNSLPVLTQPGNRRSAHSTGKLEKCTIQTCSTGSLSPALSPLPSGAVQSCWSHWTLSYTLPTSGRLYTPTTR